VNDSEFEAADVEARVRELFVERVDAQVGPRRPAPPFDPNRVGPRRTRRASWVMPLLAAACVAAVVAGAVGVTRVVASGGDDPAATHRPAPSATTGVPTSPAAVVPKGTPTVVALDGATIALPGGWVATPVNGPAGGTHEWCLQPEGTSADVCGLALYHVGTAQQAEFDAGREGFGVLGDPPQYLCGNEPSPVTTQDAQVSFGGRAAEYRLFDHYCRASGQRHYVVQYAVADSPVWAMLAEPSDATTRGAMQLIARDSTLPAS